MFTSKTPAFLMDLLFEKIKSKHELIFAYLVGVVICWLSPDLCSNHFISL